MVRVCLKKKAVEYCGCNGSDNTLMNALKMIPEIKSRLFLKSKLNEIVLD